MLSTHNSVLTVTITDAQHPSQHFLTGLHVNAGHWKNLAWLCFTGTSSGPAAEPVNSLRNALGQLEDSSSSVTSFHVDVIERTTISPMLSSLNKALQVSI